MYTQEHNNKSVTKEFSDKDQENVSVGNIWPTCWNVPTLGKHNPHKIEAICKISKIL